MIDVMDLKETRYECSDLADLQTLVKQLIGQPFQFVRVAYGDELRLHLGPLVGYSNPRLSRRMRGSYIIGARASSWVIFSARTLTLLATDSVTVLHSGNAAKKTDIRHIETGNYIAPGTVVVQATSEQSPSGFTLHLVFSDGSTAIILPNPETYDSNAPGAGDTERESAMEISDWEILTPYERVLRVGPGARWCYLDSTKRRGESAPGLAQ